MDDEIQLWDWSPQCCLSQSSLSSSETCSCMHALKHVHSHGSECSPWLRMFRKISTRLHSLGFGSSGYIFGFRELGMLRVHLQVPAISEDFLRFSSNQRNLQKRRERISGNAQGAEFGRSHRNFGKFLWLLKIPPETQGMDPCGGWKRWEHFGCDRARQVFWSFDCFKQLAMRSSSDSYRFFLSMQTKTVRFIQHFLEHLCLCNCSGTCSRCRQSAKPLNATKYGSSGSSHSRSVLPMEEGTYALSGSSSLSPGAQK